MQSKFLSISSPVRVLIFWSLYQTVMIACRAEREGRKLNVIVLFLNTRFVKVFGERRQSAPALEHGTTQEQ